MKFFRYAILLFAVFMVGAALLSAVREWGPGYFKKELAKAKTPPGKKCAEDWLRAVQSDDYQRAMLAAARLATEEEDSTKLPPLDYLRLTDEIKLNSKALTDYFGRLDYAGWRSAWRLNELAEKIAPERNEDIAALVKEVWARVKLNAPSPETKPAQTPFETWERAWGGVEERARLLFALSVQCGYEPMLAVFRGKSGGISGYLCEFRRDGKVLIADPVSGELWEGQSVESFLKNPENIPASTMQRLGDEHIYMYPAELLDYREANRRLQEALAASGVAKIPVFGRDPERMVMRYLEEHLQRKSGLAPCVSYWRIPIAGGVELPGLPKTWRKEPGKDASKNP